MNPQYLELFSTIGKNKSSDIFSLGIILWEISSGNSPFEMESSSKFDLLKNIIKGKREMAIPGAPHKYKEIYSDCWKHNTNSRPDISQVVKNLSEIIISDESVEIVTPQFQPYNVIADKTISIKLEKLNMQIEEPEIKPNPLSFDVTAGINVFIKDLLEFIIDFFSRQSREIIPTAIKNYLREHKKNPVEILYEMISPSYHWFTSLIGLFYLHGIGTVVDYQMAFKFFNLAANQIIDTEPSNSSSLRNFNKEIGTISLADMYFDGLGVEKDTKKAFQIYSKVADEGSLLALNTVAYCYDNGIFVEKNEEKALELYLKSAEKGFIVAQYNVGWRHENATGIIKDKDKGFQWTAKSALAGNVDAICNVGYSYSQGIGVDKDDKKAFKWYLMAAEKELNTAQYNLGWCYNHGKGIDRDYKKAFEWYKKAAENDYSNGQYMLGRCFYEGRGTRKDIINAIYWLNKAKENKENGDADANELLEEIINSEEQY
ncbi:hypothetical protein Glove_117g124 [Diversispora epigaea]|uniref:Protein kinase domain-containing protein n=1 Tax=Diversispora epigaea TaxID=1348612 RepID=A0A397J0R5_9GLOM|nr:hypothetical protein Glove_117g124 [Diversispora epigaea]